MQMCGTAALPISSCRAPPGTEGLRHGYIFSSPEAPARAVDAGKSKEKSRSSWFRLGVPIVPGIREIFAGRRPLRRVASAWPLFYGYLVDFESARRSTVEAAD